MKQIFTTLSLALLCGATAMAQDGTFENPLDAPYLESFANGEFTGPKWTIEKISGADPSAHPVQYLEEYGIGAYKHRDKGFFLIENTAASEFYLLSPWMTVPADFAGKGANIHYAYYQYPGITVNGYVQYDDNEMEEDVNLDGWPCDPQQTPAWVDYGATGWPEYGDQTGSKIRFGWKITTDGTGGIMVLDEIGFSVRTEYDFCLLNSSATPNVKRGDKVIISTEVGCMGVLTDKRFEVTADIDGTPVGEAVVPDRGPWGARHTKCLWEYTVPEDMELGAHTANFHLNFKGGTDGNLSDNEASVSFNVVGETLPTAENLAANDGTLTWDVPALGESFTDNVEKYASFDDGNMDVVYDLHPFYDALDVFVEAHGDTGAIGLYTMVDKDQQPTVYDHKWVTLHNTPNAGHLMAAMVTDLSYSPELEFPFEPSSGKKVFGFWSPENGTQNDNYMILPAINPAKRDISFMARAYSAEYPEKIEIMTSSTDTEISSFTAAKTVEVTGAEYEKVEFSAPEGTKYVAIHHIGDEGLVLAIDDLSYAMAPRTVTGYNVYRDGEKVNAEPLAEPTYTVTDDGKYSVSVVYPEGESDRTPEIDAKKSGIGEIAGASDIAPVYYNLQGIRVDNPRDGIFIEVRGAKTRTVTIGR